MNVTAWVLVALLQAYGIRPIDVYPTEQECNEDREVAIKGDPTLLAISTCIKVTLEAAR